MILNLDVNSIFKNCFRGLLFWDFLSDCIFKYTGLHCLASVTGTRLLFPTVKVTGGKIEEWEIEGWEFAVGVNTHQRLNKGSVHSLNTKRT
jgi:hypothetical protein